MAEIKKRARDELSLKRMYKAVMATDDKVILSIIYIFPHPTRRRYSFIIATESSNIYVYFYCLLLNTAALGTAGGCVAVQREQPGVCCCMG